VTRIVYLTRGHGYGHAATDVAVIRALAELRPDVEVEAASYGTGLEYYVQQGMPCADLRIDDVNDQGVDAALRVTAFLRSRATADLVVAHEVFAAPRVCAMLRCRNVLLTHWFFSEIGLPERDEWLRAAESLLVLDFEQAHVVPPELAGRVTFTGAVAKRFEVDRVAARRALGIADAERMAVITTGALTPYNAAHLKALVSKGVAAWRHFGRVFVLSHAEWIGQTPTPELYYAAADVVLANATFTTLSTLRRNAVPTIAVIGEGNPVDRLHAEFFAKQRGDADLRWAEPRDVARRLLEHLGERQSDVCRAQPGDQRGGDVEQGEHASAGSQQA
jgi:hypothetical protein